MSMVWRRFWPGLAPDEHRPRCPAGHVARAEPGAHFTESVPAAHSGLGDRRRPRYQADIVYLSMPERAFASVKATP